MLQLTKLIIIMIHQSYLMFQIVISVEHICIYRYVNVYVYMSGKAADITRECVNTLHNRLENKECKYESCGFEWWQYSCNVNCNP